MPHLILMPSGRRQQIETGTTVLDAARQMGVEIESICGGKLTCGKCKVRVEDGRFEKHAITSSPHHISPPSDQEINLLQRMNSAEYRLACACTVQGDVLAFVPEEARAHKQIIRKAATERVIEIEAAVRQVYIEVDRAELGQHRGDWGRVQDALAQQWDLHNLTIDWLVLRRVQAALRQGDWAVTVTLWHNKEVLDIQPGYVEGIYGLAVDIGSTTIAGYLCDLRTGAVLATESLMNPQITYGEDLMSRISYAMTDEQGLDKMHKAVLDALNTLSARAAAQAGLRRRDIHEAVLVGNTTMIHILLGINPIELGGAPFALANRDALDVKARDMGLRLHEAAYVHILPAEAGHVGADNVAAVLAEEPHHQEALTLLVDVGTNAEIVLGNREKLYSASSPTGPAFEGAQIAYGMRAALGAIERVRIDAATQEPSFRVIGEPRWSAVWSVAGVDGEDDPPAYLAAGICGSGIIEVVAELFVAGVVQADGRFDPACASPRVSWEGRRGRYMLATAAETSNGEPIYVTQDDIRAIQLAKAALYAGAKLLMRRAGVSHVERIVLAGAFGSFIDPKYAMLLGLIPDCDLAKVTAVGNAAGDGARIALLNVTKRREAQALAENITYIETAVDPHFQDEFVGAIAMPHATDAFPHLAGFLPEPAPATAEPRRRRRGER